MYYIIIMVTRSRLYREQRKRGDYYITYIVYIMYRCNNNITDIVWV